MSEISIHAHIGVAVHYLISSFEAVGLYEK